MAANTKKYKKSRNTKKRTHNNRMSASKRQAELYTKNKKRNIIIRNIRMGRSTFNRLGGGVGGGVGGYMRRDGFTQQGGSSPFVGSPWTVSNNPNTGNYFAPSPLGVEGGGLLPKFDDGQPLSRGGERWPTQLGPQLAKLGETKGGGSRSRRSGRRTKTSRGGGVFDDIKGIYNNAVSSATEFSSRLQGKIPPPSSNPWDQPIGRSNV